MKINCKSQTSAAGFSYVSVHIKGMCVLMCVYILICISRYGPNLVKHSVKNKTMVQKAKSKWLKHQGQHMQADRILGVAKKTMSQDYSRG